MNKDEAREAARLAIKFHDTYERLAPQFGYETRPDTKAFDPESPNGKLMIAVCGEILDATDPFYYVECAYSTCGIRTLDYYAKAKAIESWNRRAAEETPTPSLEERNAKHKQWQDVVRSKGYISELSKVLSFISFSNDEHTWLEIKFESGTVRMDLYENKIKVVGPFLFSKQTASNAAEITFSNDLPNKQIAAAKAEWIEEFIRECGEADYSLKDGYFAEVLRSVAEKMKESQNGK